jgi:GDP-L-fucose synthase
MQKYNEAEHINVGTGKDVKIWELANIISNVVGFPGEILWDFTKPNGTPRKVLNIDKILELGWEPKISIFEGISRTYEWYKNEQTSNF